MRRKGGEQEEEEVEGGEGRKRRGRSINKLKGERGRKSALRGSNFVGNL